MRRPATAALAIAAAVFVTGCGGGEDAGDSDRAEITTLLEDLVTAQREGDAQTACSELYVIQEPERPGGGTEGETGGSEAEAETEAEAEGGEEGADACERAFDRAAAQAGAVDELSTEVGAIEIDGDRAIATVRTELQRSDGSALSQDVPYDLVKTPEGWRIRISEEG